MNVLVICQGPAYGDERSYNGLRLAGALAHGANIAVDPESLSLVAATCRDHEEIRFQYQRAHGEDSHRSVAGSTTVRRRLPAIGCGPSG
jgi:hypothetical protein